MKKLRVHALLASIVLLLGLVMLIAMIVIESEPGGIPVVAVLVGAGWLIATCRRMQRHHA